MGHPNGVILQTFHWYSPGDGGFWKDLQHRAPEWAARGFTAVWLPPAYKGQGGAHDVGYGVYDLFDLGEFHQKGTVRTKYGTRDEFLAAVGTLRNNGLQVYLDAVFNHRDGGDETEDVTAQEVDWHDRNRVLSDPQTIRIWSRFTFPGRNGKYSTMQWFWWNFDAVSHNEFQKNVSKIFRLKDKRFSTEVSHEHGNYDYLMACDIDTSNEFSVGELQYWGRWILDTTGADGFRADAVKHIRFTFFRDWLNHLRAYSGRELFTVGEFWSSQVEELHGYITRSGGRLHLFDVPLHFRLHHASRAESLYDLRTIFDKTLVKEQPALAVTFVDNHDSQWCQSLESGVEPWFKPHAYALILLRREGYPCVFRADYDGASYEDRGRQASIPRFQPVIDPFLAARRDYGFGDQEDYFDHPNTVGWVRLGTGEHPGSMAVVLTNGTSGSKWMNVHRPYASFRDATDHLPMQVMTNEYGWGHFLCPDKSVSVWLQE